MFTKLTGHFTWRRLGTLGGHLAVVFALFGCEDDPQAPTKDFSLTCTEHVTSGHQRRWVFAVSPGAGIVTVTKRRSKGAWSTLNRKGRYYWDPFDRDMFYFPPPGKPGRPRRVTPHADPEPGAWGVIVDRETRLASAGCSPSASRKKTRRGRRSTSQL
jgi:hypothetical protein